MGLVAGVAMPFWNIPLIMRIIKRKSSEDISLMWVFGIWGCIVVMLPASLISSDPVLRSFGITNAVLFSVVVGVVLRYRRPPGGPGRG